VASDHAADYSAQGFIDMFSRTAIFSIPTGPTSGMIDFKEDIDRSLWERWFKTVSVISSTIRLMTQTLASPRSEAVAALEFKDFLHDTSIDRPAVF